MNILDQIIANKRNEIEHLKRDFTIKDYEGFTYYNRQCISLKSSLSSFGIIAEIKRKSPSAGDIDTSLNPIFKAQEYQQMGASGISCLTDGKYFGGSVQDLEMIRPHTELPILRKEFIIDEIQIFESKAIGADAILLISEVLTKEEILHFTILAQSLGMEVLLELHSPTSLLKLNDQVDIIGINNRNLQKQETTLETSFKMIDLVPQHVPLISESGIRYQSELDQLQEVGFKGALIGESILNRSFQPLTLAV